MGKVADDQFRIPPDLRVGDGALNLPAAGEVNWGMEMFPLAKLREAGRDGEGLKIGIIDTGVDERHEILSANFGGARDFTGSRFGARDVHGHGTHCTGTVAADRPQIGVCNKAKWYHGKGLGDSGSGGNSLMDAMEWALSEGCKVLSCSWGGGSPVAEWERKFRDWTERGAVLVFAAGNSGGGTSQTDYPGRSPYLINVAALDRSLKPATFTSAGAKIDTAGPGVAIWSARPNGGFVQMSGTSMACPFVAGEFGLLVNAYTIRGIKVPPTEELREILFNRSTDVHTPGDDNRTGPGYFDPSLMVNLLDSPRFAKR